MKNLQIILDGSDWEADYFVDTETFNAWKSSPRNLHNMLRSSAASSGFISGAVAPGAMAGTIPGCDRTFLIENNCCNDPFYGRNLEHTEFAEKYSWSFRKSFAIPESLKNHRFFLELKGIDYEAMICINGEWLGIHKGMFVPARYDITQYLKSRKENWISLIFSPAPKGLPNHYDGEPADFAKYHRTQIGFGWDWSRGFVPVGIYDSVIITAYEKAFLLEKQVLFDGKKAELKVEIESRNDFEVPFICQLTPDNFTGKGARFEQKLSLHHGRNLFTFSLPLPDDLSYWYPNGYGTAALYRIRLDLDGNVTEFTTGFKRVEMTRNPDSPADAENLTFNINGKDIFVKGVNYVPADLILSRVTPGDYEYLVLLAAKAGINYFRVWGGGVIEKESFYDACDRYGILVHQEFMHACSCYPKDEEFLAFKKKEARFILRKIANHPSVVLICGGNEVQYYGESAESPILNEYRAITKEILPYTPYRISSPDLSRPGERHHGPWNFKEHSVYNGHFRCFCSEIGCNGMPEFASLKRFIPEKEIGVMKGPALEYHFYNRATAHDLGIPLERFAIENMEQFCKASMFAQADIARYTMEHYRRLAPAASGCIFWQYNEPWPTCSYSIVDYYGVPKHALYAMKQANEPLLLSLKDNSWCCPDLWLDAEWFLTTEETFSGELSLEAVDCATGGKLFCAETEGTFTPGTHLLKKIKEHLTKGVTAVFFYANKKYTGVRLYGVPDYKTAFTLPDAEISVSRKGRMITLENIGQTVAVNLRLEIPGSPDKTVIFSDNYLTIAPGQKMTVNFSGGNEQAEINITGWNFGYKNRK